MNIDQDRMQQVVQQAFDLVAGDRRWEKAIVKAKQQFESNPYMHFDGDALLMLSETEYASARRSLTANRAGTVRLRDSSSGTTRLRTKAKRDR